MAFDVESHFSGRSDVVRRIYDDLVGAARKFGPVEEDPKKLRSTSTGKEPLLAFKLGGTTFC